VSGLVLLESCGELLEDRNFSIFGDLLPFLHRAEQSLTLLDFIFNILVLEDNLVVILNFFFHFYKKKIFCFD
jgi:hypothetical protein